MFIFGKSTIIHTMNLNNIVDKYTQRLSLIKQIGKIVKSNENGVIIMNDDFKIIYSNNKIDYIAHKTIKFEITKETFKTILGMPYTYFTSVLEETFIVCERVNQKVKDNLKSIKLMFPSKS